MPTFILCLFFLLQLSVPTTPSTGTAPSSYQPIDLFLINCGSSGNTTYNEQTWVGDSGAKLNFLPPNMANISSEATAVVQGPSIDQGPCMTARIFHYLFTYTFPVSPGPKFLRLYFNPTTYSGGFNGKQSFFAVSSNGYTLLNNFSAFLTVSAPDPRDACLVKEFIINVEDNQMLNVTFSPSSNSSCFVNGIEIVSMPDDLYFGERDVNHPIKDVSTSSPIFNLDKSNTALEKLYRLNVGGNYVPEIGDVGMFRVWYDDSGFILGADKGYTGNGSITRNYTSKTPPYSAPDIIYATARDLGDSTNRGGNILTWTFPVDPGFRYMLRLHFCDFLSDTENQRVSNISIGNKTAEPQFDIIYNSGGQGIPIVRDYAVLVPPQNGPPSKQDLWFTMTPSLGTKPERADVFLNGLEIFKLSTARNLAGPNPMPKEAPHPPLEPKRKNSKSGTKIYAVLGGVIGVAVVILMAVLLILRRRKWMRESKKSKGSKMNDSGSLSLPSNLCRHFSLKELKFATADFDKNFVIGTGGFGNVYKGYIDNGAVAVAIKRLNPSSNQGAHEFRTEIEMLSELRHLHLVSLIGYCDEHGEMILVYDYMANGTLRDHLYKTENPPLPWKQRLQICIGAAKGLHYLHTGAKHNIIHRDVKSTNILLDDKWVAKVSDFGLSKVGPTSGIDSHVSTAVKGSVGYVDPEYYKKQQLTDKSDVYSFGVVLFEVLCARPVIIPILPREEVNLVEWARHSYRNGKVDGIIDPNIKGKVQQDCLRSYVEIALSCVKDRGIERPPMNDVVWSLEFALQLQETAETNAHELNKPEIPLLLPGGEATTTDDEEAFSRSGDSAAKSVSNSSATITSSSSGNKLQSDTVFSEIINPAEC